MLLKALPGCSKLKQMQLKCKPLFLSLSPCTRHSQPASISAAAAGNSFTQAGYTAFINAAADAAKATDPKKAIGCVAGVAHMIPASSLKTAGLPVELEGNTAGILAYLRHIHKGGHRHATLVLVGPPGVGKSSLVWRMQHPDKEAKLPEPDKLPTGGANTCTRDLRSAQQQQTGDWLTHVPTWFCSYVDATCSSWWGRQRR